MTPLVPIALFGWPIFVLLLFATIPARRAVLVGMIAGWLFLPMAGYQFADIPDYDKYAAVSLSVLVGSIVFDPRALASLRPRLMCRCSFLCYHRSRPRWWRELARWPACPA